MELKKYLFDGNRVGDEIKIDKEFIMSFTNSKCTNDQNLKINYVGDYISGDEISVAIIGSRKITEYGKRACEYISGSLASSGVTIVSGLMYGVDLCAHRAAISSGGRTIAVLGYGLNHLSKVPYALSLTRQIASSKVGVVISEFENDQYPQSWTFPKRNKLIAFLSRIVIVIEADENSGSLITVDNALDMDKEVYAVPGSIFSSRSRGTNKLIKDGANVLTDPKEILEILKKDITMPTLAKSLNPELDGEQKILIDLIQKRISDDLATNLDILCSITGIPSERINVLITQLEFENLIVKDVAGNIHLKF